MASIAALSGAGSLAQALTIRVRSGQEGIEFRESIRESSSEFPIKTGGERGIRTPYEVPDSLGKTGKHTEKDTEISVIPGHDLSRIVSVWAKLPYPLKAAILAIVGTVDASPEVKR